MTIMAARKLTATYLYIYIPRFYVIIARCYVKVSRYFANVSPYYALVLNYDVKKKVDKQELNGLSF